MDFLKSHRVLLAAALLVFAHPKGYAQSTATDVDPIIAAQTDAARRWTAPSPSGASAIEAALDDPIRAAQVMQAIERTFPNLAEDLKAADLLSKAAADPRMRGNLLGRSAEDDFLERNAKQGWQRVNSPTAPQNDVWRWVEGKRQGGQIKVHKDWKKYLHSMQDDNKAEHFFIPDDHYDLVRADLETRRLGALRGGLSEKAEDYARQQKRLAKLGRTFAELDGSIECASKNFSRISAALRSAGKAAPFVGVALGLLDGTISAYEVASGKMEVQNFMIRITKAGVAGAASWATGEASLDLLGAAGSTGAVPVVLVIVVATATYFVVDLAIDYTVKSFKTECLTSKDVALLWPAGIAQAIGKK